MIPSRIDQLTPDSQSQFCIVISAPGGVLGPQELRELRSSCTTSGPGGPL